MAKYARRRTQRRTKRRSRRGSTGGAIFVGGKRRVVRGSIKRGIAGGGLVFGL